MIAEDIMQRALLMLPFALLLAGACGSEPAAPGQGKGAVITGHASALEGDFERAAFGCCADPAEQAALDALVELGAAMAADDAPGSAAAAERLRAAVSGPPRLEPLRAPAAAVAEAAELPARREALLALSEAARALPLGGDGPGRYAWVLCPMKPGRWLQRGEPVANPYYGASMLRCGNFEARAPVPAPDAPSAQTSAAAPAPVR
jgi:hypothetical protein